MTRPLEFISPFRDGPVVTFVRVGPGRVRCEACDKESPIGVQTLRWVDAHLLQKHPGWGEARVETR